MQYILMLYVNEAGWPKLTPAEQEQGMAAYNAYTEALTKANALKATGRLSRARMRPRCASPMANRRYSMVRMRTRRSSSAATT